jgi:hypothetical protein
MDSHDYIYIYVFREIVKLIIDKVTNINSNYITFSYLLSKNLC